GRGIALYALVGKGITAENIAKAAGFLVGECSCEVRRQNPGVDLLMAADWETGAELGSLAGLSAGRALESASAPERSPMIERDDSRLLTNALLGTLLGLTVVGGLGFLLLRRSKGAR